MPKLSVVIAGYWTITAEALAGAFRNREDIEVVGIAVTGERVVELVESLRPDAIVLGVRLSGMNGIDAARLVHHRYPSIAIIMLSAYDQKRYVIDAMRAGATGFIPPTCNIETLAQTILSARVGLATFDSRVIERLLNLTASKSSIDRKTDLLNARETEVLRLVALGRGNREIADTLYISPRTVQSHLANIFRKLDVKTRTEAVTVSISKGFLEVKDLPDLVGSP